MYLVALNSRNKKSRNLFFISKQYKHLYLFQSIQSYSHHNNNTLYNKIKKIYKYPILLSLHLVQIKEKKGGPVVGTSAEGARIQ